MGAEGHMGVEHSQERILQKKLERLEKYYERVVDAEVILRVNNSAFENKTVEIKFNIPRHQLFAKESASTFETATDLALDVIKRNLLKLKEKLVSH